MKTKILGRFSPSAELEVADLEVTELVGVSKRTGTNKQRMRKKNIKMKNIRLILLIIALMLSAPAWSQDGKNISDEWLRRNYTKREVMIPMRDGARLYTAVYEPKFDSGEKPIMLSRTPYSLKPYGFEAGENPSALPQAYSKGMRSDFFNYAADGYVIVLQNVRGTFLSEGDFENIRPHLSGKAGGLTGRRLVDEATDTYDTVEWLLANTRSNGNVGVKGVSYPGFYATMAALSRHPAIKAVSPQAPVTDWFMGDDAHHNGALCLTDSYRFGSSMYRSRKTPSTKGLAKLVSIDSDIYEYFCGRSLSELSAFFGDTLAFWNRMVEHPDYDAFWKDRDPSRHLVGIEPAVLVTGGFYDAEDCYGAFRTYSSLKNLSPDRDLYLAAGPWRHGGWTDRKADHIAGAYFGSGSAAYYLDEVEYPFFTFYLEGKGSAPAKVSVLPSGETMKQAMDGVKSDSYWTEYSSWPPEGTTSARIFLSTTDSLNISGRPARKGFRSFISSPTDPVPYMDVKSSGRDYGYMAADQSFAAVREDVLSYTGRILSDTLHLAGPVKAHVEFRLDLPDGRKAGDLDADIVVKLIDVRPDGYRMLVRGDVMPIRFRDGFGKAKAAKSSKVYGLDFTMCDIDHLFLPGHSLMIQIQGSWFPVIAMNPQTFVSNPFSAKDSDYRPIRISISSDSFIECGKVN